MPQGASRIFPSIPALCRGDSALLEQWLSGDLTGSLKFCIAAIFIGCGSYGTTMGLWQGWQMAAYVGIKFPLVIFATLIFNGLINGMLAIAIGSGISMRATMQFLLSGFSLMAIILGSLVPITLLMALHAPSPDDVNNARSWHSTILLMHTAVIAYAGITSHYSLLKHVRKFAASPTLGTQTFFIWLVTNLFVGAQISWVMRPFFGSPGLEVQFLRDQPFDGNFYESLFRSLQNLL